MRERRGSALILALTLVLGMGALALSAIYLSSNARLISGGFDRERDFKFIAEGAVARGKSRVNTDTTALPPDTGYKTLDFQQTLTGADGKTIPGVTYSTYIGRSGLISGEYGNFASVVADVRDAAGSRFVRRLELEQESFAKFAYWSNQESNNGNPIYFGGGDNLWGPVWSNDQIKIDNTGATFHDSVGTAQNISNAGAGTFLRGYQTGLPVITLPSVASLNAKLQPLAAAGGLSFIAPNSTDETTVLERIEFVATDLSNPPNADSTGVDEGFLRVYKANAGNVAWLRGDLGGATPTQVINCGDWHPVVPGGPLKFFPAAVHPTTWFRRLDSLGTGSNLTSKAESSATLATIMGHAQARCYPGGDPHLVAIERNGAAGYAAPAWQKGGEDSTFTPTGVKGAWIQWAGAVDPRLSARRPFDASYLFPLYRGVNTNAKGVIHVNGTVAISGNLRGRVTLYSTGYIVVVDDARYATDPAAGQCADVLGLIAAKDVVVADNAINTPQTFNGGATYNNLDDNTNLDLHAVIMALGTSFRVQNYGSGPISANGCGGTLVGRGCLNLTGGLIQNNRGPVGQLQGGGITGYVKRYSYDRCGAIAPPPYFPTTGRFLDNRYFEIDPAKFAVGTLYQSIQRR